MLGFCDVRAQYRKTQTAVILVCLVVAFNVLLIKRWKVFAVFMSSYAISLPPMIISVMNHPESMTSRFSLLSVWTGSGGAIETMSRMFDRYLEYFGPSFLFVSGDPANLRHHTGNSGELYIFMLPFIISGIYCFYRGFLKNAQIRFAVLLLAFYPVAAILTIDHMHSTRSINGAIPWGIVSIVGAEYMLNRRRKITFRIALYSMLVFSIFETGCYFNYYFGKYVERSRLDFLAPYTEAFEYSFRNMKPGETLYVSASAIPQKTGIDFKPFWYSRLLFFGKVSPSAYQAGGIPRDYICAYQGKAYAGGILIRKNIVNQGRERKHCFR
jgi:hypothetical protein